ncbi:ATP-binding protein [Arthrobacter crystallopoietes]|uniref:ATP-binding protein n=1 Tax=Crystallibacter crystallopoietes TaxID=37928 RepID=UPI001110FC46|nr:ATP-binding protein [Arthrobacter crystallopoietes]
MHGSGLQPGFLAGRQAEIDAFDLLLVRTERSFSNRGMVLSGLRGVGKTVLLNRLRGLALHHDWLTIKIEGQPGEAGAAEARKTLARELQVASRRYIGRVGLEKFRQLLGTVTSFTAGFGVEGISLGVERDPARAGTGLIEIDLRDLIEDVSAAMRSIRKGFIIFIDEMQDLDEDLLSALVTCQHHAGQLELPFYIVGAGLPNLPARLAEVRSYAERLFDFRLIGTLAEADARESFTVPAKQVGAEYGSKALDILVDVTGRYPYFIQEFGSAMWEVAQASPFTEEDAQAAATIGLQRLDSGFFPSRWDRATPREREYLATMALDGDQGSSTGEIAQRLSAKATSLAPTRGQLIAKGLIYSSEYGKVAFTVPGMADFIKRQHHEI